MNESKTVVWFAYLDQDGNKETWTFRQEDREADDKFLERITKAKRTLKVEGYVPLSGGAPNVIPANVTTGTPNAAPVEGAVQTKFIEVNGIQLVKGGDNPRFVVKGGNFTKHGVTCWKEPLVELGIFDEITDYYSNASAMQELEDYIPSAPVRAMYSEKMHNGKQSPDKVTRLEWIT